MENGFNLDNFNSFLENANSQLLCGTECQQKKNSQQLHQNYLNAVTNVQTAPSQLNEAEKAWISYSQGPAAYTQMQNTNFTEKAQSIVDKFVKKFNREASEITDQIQTYTGVFNNCANVYDLYIKYKDENVELTKMLTDDNADVNTNNRKTYYENQEVEFQEYIHKYILIIYILTVIGYAFCAVTVFSPFDWKVRFGVLVFLISLIFTSSYVLAGIIWIFQKMYGILPKNVYINL